MNPTKRLCQERLAIRINRNRKNPLSDEEIARMIQWRNESPPRSFDWIAYRLRLPESLLRFRWKKLQASRAIPNPLALLELI